MQSYNGYLVHPFAEPLTLPSLVPLTVVFCICTVQKSFSKISVDSGTISHLIAEISKGKRPFFCTFMLILF